MGKRERLMGHQAIYNTPIEIGTRAALILTVLDSKVSLDDLVIYDYALLYSAEFGGPDNLHPAIPNHVAEIAHRREHLPDAIRFFIKRGLIDIHITESGHYYSSNECTLDFVSCLKSNYYKKAWKRLDWLSANKKTVINTTFIDLATRRT